MSYHTLDSIRETIKSILIESPSYSHPTSTHPTSFLPHPDPTRKVSCHKSPQSLPGTDGDPNTEKTLLSFTSPIIKKKQSTLFNVAPPQLPVASSSNPLDFIWIGTKLTEPKSKTSRLWFQNINGIKSAKNFAGYHDILSEFTKYNVDYFAFSETKLANPQLLDIYRLMDTAMKYGVVLDRYRQTVTTLIAKEDNMPKIHRLRPIQLVEVELQAISTSQWCKKLVGNAERKKLLAEGQYGGRNNRQAQSEVLNKVLSFDLGMLMIKPYTFVDEELKANFDREMAPLGALEDKTYGASAEFGSYLQKTASSQHFHVKTKF